MKMNCEQVTGLLSDYLDGSLPFRKRTAIGLHLFFCRNCRRYLNSFRKTRQLVRSLANRLSITSEPSIAEDLVQAILTSPGREPANEESAN